MVTELDPIVGNWYAHADKGQAFVVISVDEQDELAELQHFDGDIEEVSFRDWYEMELELSEAPEDWSGPVDNVEQDDTGYTETRMSNEAWSKPLQENPRDRAEDWERTEAEDEQDEWAEGSMPEESWEQDQVENTLFAAVETAEEAEEPEESEPGV